MSLKKKLTLLVLISCCILALTFMLGFNITLFPSLKDQKVIFIENQKEKITRGLKIEQDDISTLCDEWSGWVNIIQDLAHPMREFQKFGKNASPNDIFSVDFMDVVIIPGMDGTIHYYKNHIPGKGYILLNKISIHDEMTEIINRIKRSPEPVKSIIKTNYGPIMIVANPIVDRENADKVKGILVLGRYVDERMINRISFYTMEDIKPQPLSREELWDFDRRQMRGKDVQYREHENIITVFHMLKDIHQTPAMVLYTEKENSLFRVMRSNILTFSIMNICLICLLGLMLYFSIDKYIIKRMLNISDRMIRIEGLNDLSIRIDNDNQNDEVSYLISNINLTLDRLEQEKVDREFAEKSMLKQAKLASIGRLTSSIAHEVNNPLMAIGNSLQVIKKIARKRTGKNSSLLNEAVDISESEVERIRVIISALLDFHRMDKEDFSRINLKKVILQSISILNWSKKLRTIEIVMDLEEDCFIMGAMVRLKQVFINFILNAAEAMGKDGGKLKLVVCSSPDGKTAEVHFTDTGPGLAGDVLGHLYEPFVTTKEDKGVGLGLYISYKIVRNHRGEIVHDEYYKDGTRFIIKLPKLRGKSKGSAKD
ncbi:MAG: hypothetical protein GY765_40685 [bacterium]|nr:hypothetical protein [bacterium]